MSSRTHPVGAKNRLLSAIMNATRPGRTRFGCHPEIVARRHGLAGQFVARRDAGIMEAARTFIA
jgi:hypothetical protein